MNRSLSTVLAFAGATVLAVSLLFSPAPSAFADGIGLDNCNQGCENTSKKCPGGFSLCDRSGAGCSAVTCKGSDGACNCD